VSFRSKLLHATSLRRFHHLPRLAVFILALYVPCRAQQLTKAEQEKGDLTQVSIESLMNMEVTTVSKREQRLSRTAAAIFVITQEDIARSGMTNIPDLLRMVPGVEVAQINSNTWAISARGLNERFSNELQVMLDGRIVYTPTFGGVYWDALDVPLENIERIEVIRGPGGTVWGSNAVNGVINVITKAASKTRGTMVVAGEGNVNQGFGTAQYGGSLGKKTDYRAYAKYLNESELPAEGRAGGDGWHVLRSGLRIDSAVTEKDSFTETGGIYTGREGHSITFPASLTAPSQTSAEQINLSGGFLQSVWKHAYSERSETNVQIFFDRYTRNEVIGETQNAFGVDFQHHFAWGERQDVVWGAGYTFSSSSTVPSLFVSMNPADISTQLFSAFIQDEIQLVANRVYVTVGTKLEHNDHTGLGNFPSARVTWTPNGRHMFWGAVSSAARIPANLDTAFRINITALPGAGGPPILISSIGNPNFKDEGLLAYEAGYRTTLASRISFDVACFYNRYDHQGTTEPAPPFFEATPAPPHIVIPVTAQNLMHGETYGTEVAANWKINQRWTLSPGYAFEQIHMHTEAGSQDMRSAAEDEGRSPRHSAQLRSHVKLPEGIGWNASADFVDRLRAAGIPGYVRVDTGLDWRWRENLTVSVVGQNLQRNRHLEFIDAVGSVNSSLAKRSAYVRLTYWF